MTPKPISKWNNDGTSVLPSHSKLNPGPEGTAYDLLRHDKMKLKNVRYGFFRVVTEATKGLLCSKCGKEIHGASLILNGIPQHYSECPK